MITCLTGDITRKEKVQIEASCKITDDNKEDLLMLMEKITGAPFYRNDGDILDVKYDFDILYFDNIEKRLAAFMELLRIGDAIVYTDIKSLNTGEIIIKQLSDRIKECKKIIEEKKSCKA